MMKIHYLNNFVKDVTNNKTDFTLVLNENGVKIHFISCQHNNARYYYGCMDYEDRGFKGVDNEYKLAAIVANDKIYVLLWSYVSGSYIINDKDKGCLPRNVTDFYDFVAELNDQLLNKYYPTYYSELEVKTNMNNCSVSDVARIRLLSNKIDYNKKEISKFEAGQVSEILCDYTSLKSACIDWLDTQKDKIRCIKSKEVDIDNLIQNNKTDHQIAEEWEINLANAVNDTSAKTVDVEFKINAKKGEIRVKCANLIKNLITKTSFGSYDFNVSCSTGEAFLKKLEVGYEFDTKLYCKHIKSISFRGRKIYER